MKTVIHVKADKEVKEYAQELARKLGLSLSDVINASLRNFIRDREIVFSDIPKMTPEFEKKLEKIEDDIKHGRNLSPAFKNMDEADKYLKKQLKAAKRK
ncbi:hypothetical protein A3F00_00765 [Candidatus Daviesbacteria bacterium RIFCSPHIGHO2_12_FULL_37_11]|uniref:Uncharacterized protein n=1 Tax=Candidatus Daviesbacteria bacterium RIFCSPHIGHO2_12_FULL_37_11 TaxID=1797777 RepID=A0A1F5KCJ6_9BACT|nr:MAG: hypothetical protein A2111_00240 [Candidatus Daviesbacteria bacterium GWA1_38_6]OGE18057.1 MAG: hypothetical protein A2769_00110 [Candidatus Daviesbacteria bacterium RIFCSPHIGHO2_01_FULL_37_27]OGE38667.1 MAG: hypothetical protein A3F00_00765 [Candidatus Daviesbacteria bacterium RIFCSPHIGHO2_12_FULL_37_11]OGE45940.1 MAG: hypothetical protein A3B39_00735 [Candidatus Daviesbacteria bacterium RIFCSPLOWO2_01_FULL_37_10]